MFSWGGSFTLCKPYDIFLLRIPDIYHLLFHVFERLRMLLKLGAVRHRARQVFVVIRQVHMQRMTHLREEILLRQFRAIRALEASLLKHHVQHASGLAA